MHARQRLAGMKGAAVKLRTPGTLHSYIFSAFKCCIQNSYLNGHLWESLEPQAVLPSPSTSTFIYIL